MLMHHADTCFDRLLRRVEFQGLTKDVDGAFVWHVETVQNGHERGFTRAVLTNDPVDCPGLDRQIDVFIGLNRSKRFGDTVQFDSKVCHASF